MNMRELKEIRKRKSVEMSGMTTEQMNNYINKRADKILKEIEAIRKERAKNTISANRK